MGISLIVEGIKVIVEQNHNKQVVEQNLRILSIISNMGRFTGTLQIYGKIRRELE